MTLLAAQHHISEKPERCEQKRLGERASKSYWLTPQIPRRTQSHAIPPQSPSNPKQTQEGCCSRRAKLDASVRFKREIHGLAFTGRDGNFLCHRAKLLVPGFHGVFPGGKVRKL